MGLMFCIKKSHCKISLKLPLSFGLKNLLLQCGSIEVAAILLLLLLLPHKQLILHNHSACIATTKTTTTTATTTATAALNATASLQQCY